jgi:glycosyltransferase involved in cell wall biosynthesis
VFAGRLSVVVPARNEEIQLPACLSSLVAQSRPAEELLVVDDNSTDQTARVARELGATVVQPGERPRGWAGKNWAAHAGARVATGDWLLFIDADVVLAPGAIQAALAAAEAHNADVVTFIPGAPCSTLLEALVQPIFLVVLALALDPTRINDPGNSRAAAYGGFLLFRRVAYEAVGGHAAVQGDIVEDLMLARRIKARGLRLRMEVAPELVQAIRPVTWSRLWDDCARAVFGAVGSSVVLPLIGAAIAFAFLVGPYVLAPLGIGFVIAAAIHWVAVFAVRVLVGRAFGFDRRLAALQPIGGLFMVMALACAALRNLRGRTTVRWGNRVYSRSDF